MSLNTSLPPHSSAPVFIPPALRSSSDSTPISPLQFVHFRHPGYPDSLDLMFRLSALDRASKPSNPDESGTTFSTEDFELDRGVHHATALHACSIMACNEPGFLSPTKLSILPAGPASGTTLSLDSVLTEKFYWFYPVSWKLTDDPYPVCPDFENWSFPKERIPLDWIAIVCLTARVPVISVCGI